MYDRSQENIVHDKHMRGKQGRIVKEQGVYSELQQGGTQNILDQNLQKMCLDDCYIDMMNMC